MDNTATMNRAEAARYVGLAPSTLQRLWAADVGPRAIKLSAGRSGRVLYARAELDRWVAAGMPRDATGTARPSSIPRGCFSPPARGRKPRNTSTLDARERPS